MHPNFLTPAPCPATSVIIRAGHATLEETARKIKLLVKRIPRKTFNRLQYLHFDTLPVVERMICVYDSHLNAAKAALAGHDLNDFKIVGRPDGRTFGEDWEFMEYGLTKNPGQIIITDCDFMHALPMDRVPDQDHLSPEDFSAKIGYASGIAVALNINVWSVRHQNNLGATVKGMARQPIMFADTGYMETGTDYYLRNFFVLRDTAKGSWYFSNHLEEQGRLLSEKESDPSSVGLYHGCMIRYPATTLSGKRYYQTAAWQDADQHLRTHYPSLYVSPKQSSPTVFGPHKAVPCKARTLKGKVLQF